MVLFNKVASSEIDAVMISVELETMFENVIIFQTAFDNCNGTWDLYGAQNEL